LFFAYRLFCLPGKEYVRKGKCGDGSAGKKTWKGNGMTGKYCPGKENRERKTVRRKKRNCFSAIITVPGNPGGSKIQTFVLPTLVGVKTVSNDTFAFSPE
jgi:hypothetical protein